MPGPTVQQARPSPIHYRPRHGALADTIPFYHDGQYHIFYLHAGLGCGTPWEHIMSRDLIRWDELPTALPLGTPDQPDGGCVFTGCVLEHEGLFHIFYTGFNPDHPDGREQIMHATSADLTLWAKHPEDTFGADGVHYDDTDGIDFRDPFVFFNDDAGRFWMLLCARDTSGRQVTGVAESDDLATWTQIEPLTSGADGPYECPDLFQLNGRYYLVSSPSRGTTDYSFAPSLTGEWETPEWPAIDTPFLYAAKRMFDGARHVLTGWIRDLEDGQDSGAHCWGGDQCVPREIWTDEMGRLCFRPVPEAVAVFTDTVLDVRTDADLDVRCGQWAVNGCGLVAEPGNGEVRCSVDAPPDYMLRARIKSLYRAETTIHFRQPMADEPGGYRLVLSPATGEVCLASPTFSHSRTCPIDWSKPIDIVAFVQGAIIECFINDAHAFSCRAYDHPAGRLGLSATGGGLKVMDLTMSTV